MKLQDYIRKYGVQKLQDEYKIVVKTHGQYPNLHLFKYNQIESPMDVELVQQARGIILDADNNWNVVCHTYNKFFNQGESNAANIDWNTARVYEKLDGSLMQMYWYDNQWHVATSGTPDAECMVPFGNMTFRNLFWQTWGDLRYCFPSSCDAPDNCYAWELMTPYNRIVVKHEKPRLVLHGIRNIKFDYEKLPSVIQHCWETVKQYDLKDLKTILNTLEDIDPYKQEGYVVVDSPGFNRVKIKSPKYVAIHHVIGSMSQRNMLEIVRTGESDEFLAHFKEYKDLHDDLKTKYDALVEWTEYLFERYNSIKDQKEFAMVVKGWKQSGALFNVRSGKSKSVREYYKNIHIKKLEELLEVKGE